MAYIEFDRVVKEYPSWRTTIRALDEASFTADRGELTVILGQSGAGKTTALNILAAWTPPPPGAWSSAAATSPDCENATS